MIGPLESFATQLSHTLLHMLWIGAAIGVVAVVANRLLRDSSSHCYAANAGLLTMMLLSVPIVFVYVSSNQRTTDVDIRLRNTTPKPSTPNSPAEANRFESTAIVVA